MAKEITVDGVVYVEKTPASTDISMVRTYSAGVFFGEIIERTGKEIKMKTARRVWYWAGAASLSQLAVDGTTLPKKCQFPCSVPEIILTEVIEIIPISKKAAKSLNEVPTWEK